VAGKVEAIAGKQQHRRGHLGLAFGRQRVGHSGKHPVLIGDIVHVAALLRPAARRRKEQDSPDCSLQLMHQACCLGAESIAGNDRQGETIETDTASVPRAVRNLDTVTGAVQQPCEVGPQRHIPTDDHYSAAHPKPITGPPGRQRLMILRQSGMLLPACYPAVIRGRPRAARIACGCRRGAAMEERRALAVAVGFFALLMATYLAVV